MLMRERGPLSGPLLLLHQNKAKGFVCVSEGETEVESAGILRERMLLTIVGCLCEGWERIDR
jgi:hypothetical protein